MMGNGTENKTDELGKEQDLFFERVKRNRQEEMKKLVKEHMNDDHTFKSFTVDGLYDEYIKFYDGIFSNISPLLEGFFEESLLNIEEIKINKQKICKAFVQVRKNMIYLWIYHKKMVMSELNQTALLVYWILKYDVFCCEFKGELTEKYERTNVLVALSIFFIGVRRYVRMHFGEFEWKDLNKDFVHQIIHSFTNHDLSKEAIMSIAWALITRCKLTN
jgi:hypothetical protein